MAIDITTNGNSAQIKISGSFNRNVIKQDLMVSEFSTALKPSSLSRIDIDFANSTDHDTASLGWLVNVIRDIKKIDKQLSLHNVPNSLRALAKLSNVDALIFDENLNDQ